MKNIITKEISRDISKNMAQNIADIHEGSCKEAFIVAYTIAVSEGEDRETNTSYFTFDDGSKLKICFDDYSIIVYD